MTAAAETLQSESWIEAVLRPENGVVATYWNSPPYHDEPKFFHLNARLQPPPGCKDEDLEVEGDSIVTVGGSSLSKERALSKMAGEAVERFALFVNQSIPSRFCSFQSFRPEDALNPVLVEIGRGDSRRDRRLDNVDWVEGVDLANSSPVWIPSQLIFVPHLFREGEVIWRAPISTGAAAFSSLEEAIRRGLFEVVERDAFMVSWLLQITPDVISDALLDQIRGESELLRRTIERSNRYALVPKFYVLPSNLPVHVVVCVLWDETEHLPQFTFGAKGSSSLVGAAIGALEEAHQLRPWMRRLAGESASSGVEAGDLIPKNLRQRARLWLSDTAVSHMRTWLADANEFRCTLGSTDFNDSLESLVASVRRDGASVFSVETTSNLPDAIRTTGIKTAKVVVPEYQPLYLTEELSDVALARLSLSEKRLGRSGKCSVGSLFSFPHPFL